MNKGFFDVFRQVNMSQELQRLFENVTIERVVVSKSRQLVHIYMTSTRLIHSRHIAEAEAVIRDTLFADHHEIQIQIMEKYLLSEQYTQKKLMQVYFESIQNEFKRLSHVEYRVIQNARWSMSENILRISVEDTFIARQKEPRMCDYIVQIIRERFGYEIEVEFDYSSTDSKLRERNAIKVQQAVSQIVQQSEKLREEPKEESAPKPKEGQKKTKQGNSQPSNGYKNFRKKLPDDPDIIYGRPFEGEETAIEEITQEIGEVVIKGYIMNMDARETRTGKMIYTLSVTDYTDSIQVKIFLDKEQSDEFQSQVKKGRSVRLQGIAKYDPYDKDVNISSVRGMKNIPDFTSKRIDTYPQKRIELHAHTHMSDMDSVMSAKSYLQRALQWGHKGAAITDHGVVQGFTDAYHVVQWDKAYDDFKVIYGMEAYLVDDLKESIVHSANQSLMDDYVVFDIETTGLNPKKNRLIEIGAVKVSKGKISETYSTFVNPHIPIPFEIEQLTGIDDTMVVNAPSIEKVLPEFLEFAEGSVLVAHNAGFDVSFIDEAQKRLGQSKEFTVVDTIGLARALMPKLSRFKLNIVAKNLGIKLENHHRAVDDAKATAEIFVKFIEMLEERGLATLDEVQQWTGNSVDSIRKMPSYHAILLVQNETGRRNLYRLVSESHLTYFHQRPKIPKSLLNQYREGLILGSACEAGELYRGLLEGRPYHEISEIVAYYDYMEIQPTGNNMFLLEKGKYGIETVEHLQDLNKEIIRLGKESGKLTVATCDVHFLEPRDELYRRIIMAGKGFKDADNQAPLYYRTTNEMLEEFAYLGDDLAEEVVITNTNIIAEKIEKMSPVRPDKCPPVIENSHVELREICYSKAHEIYGGELPTVVEERLERELKSIIGNGFAVMYIIAQKLVWESNRNGYLVGSRGSVGSSFAATMAGITEVNPLQAHYICPSCRYSDFESEEVLRIPGRAGCDLPDAVCPHCGTQFMKEGHDIPFETFLGFKGDKEPDIDLNFSGDYQSKAHEYTEVLFGKGYTFKAGTIGTMAEKTAYGFVWKYYEERQLTKRRVEMERIAAGCTGVRRTTGQHPGGIIVLPKGEEIYSFTPIQHPANDMESKIITTHFDYHSIDHNLLKLDILGHDDPTIIRMLEDLTGVDAKTIPLDDKKVMSLFDSPVALGIDPEDIDGIPTGSLGIPEFGTDFVIQMLVDTKPKQFSDLVRISGLSHGTDVWLGNAQTLIQEGKAEISTSICTRDDIMTYLIGMGLEKGLSFTIMESVRKGKGLKPEWEEEMTNHQVPDWYIWSCKKIKYMFPKAHAAAYVMMAWRIAYFKVYYPLEYYCAYFSIRAKSFDYEMMCQGKEKLLYHMNDYKKRVNELSNKEESTAKEMRIVQEMYARGYEFVPIDIFKANAHRCQIVDGKIMPSMDSIEGLGENAADTTVLAAKEGDFLSIDDFRTKAKVTKTSIEVMRRLHLLPDLPETNQLSLFDLDI